MRHLVTAATVLVVPAVGSAQAPTPAPARTASTEFDRARPRLLGQPLGLHVDLFANDLQPANLALAAGTRRFHAFITAGLGRAEQFIAGGGLGVHFGRWLWVDLDLSCLMVQALTGTQPTDVVVQVRGSVGIQVTPHVAFFLGPSYNAEVSFAPNAVMQGSALRPLLLLAPPSGGGGWQFWTGLQGGVRISVGDP